ncbi:hypothetical protein PAL_GLEAN10003034 [Pteropus alecto]|uniref:Uncharacterized protein n=1 Tax=Pteropus alecto TaxID=9402 RepID=L5KC71_PTEAL|nr:hypothetical protein PAL_GLEAN10003034 [Pteropus alecto]
MQQEGPIIRGGSSELHPVYSHENECEELVGTQDTGGAQGGAVSHPVIVTDKLTPKTGLGVGWSVVLTTKAAITWGITVDRSTKRLTSAMWV